MCFPYIMANVDPDRKKGKNKRTKNYSKSNMLQHLFQIAFVQHKYVSNFKKKNNCSGQFLNLGKNEPKGLATL